MEIFDHLDDLALVQDAFTWDCSLSTYELSYSGDGRTVTKLGSPDCSLVLGSMPFESGLWFFEVYIQHKGDETWVGVTNDRQIAFLQYKTTDTMTSESVCAYYDSRRSYRRPPVKNRGQTLTDLNGQQYGVGNAVGVLVDVDRGNLCFYLDGKFQSLVNGIPEGVLWPVAHLDATDDCYILRRTLQLPEGCLLVE